MYLCGTLKHNSEMKKITKENFFLQTVGIFQPCAAPSRKADYTSVSRGGASWSHYWYEDGGVVRHSNHWSWGGSDIECDWIRSCWWELHGEGQTGFVKFADLVDMDDINKGVELMKFYLQKETVVFRPLYIEAINIDSEYDVFNPITQKGADWMRKIWKGL